MPPQDRLFIPLSSEPFEDFRDREKQYEIRAYGRQFTEKNVREGRRVELRKGYSSRKGVLEKEWQLWGTIGRVIFGSLEDIFAQVDDYRDIEPRARSTEEAIAENRNMLGEKPKYIGFHVKLND